MNDIPDDSKVAGKECPDCRTAKGAEEFGTNRERLDGLSFYCRACLRRRATDSYRKRRRAGGHSLRYDRGSTPAGHRFCNGCQGFVPVSDWFSNRGSRSGLSSYCKRCMRVKGAESHLRRTYGLSATDYQRVSRTQGGVCAICRDGAAAHVDHDHETGRVRGLLCFNCNAGLGQFKDKTELLMAAMTYLRESRGASEQSVNSLWPRAIELFPYRGAEIEVERWRHPIGA